jgi:outer membrane protein assembly factor BamB
MTTLRRFILALGLCVVVASVATAQNNQGPNRDNVGNESGLLKTWPEGGPKQAWLNRDVGAGYAGPAIVDGRMYIMGTRDDAAHLFCLDANEGTEIWAAEICPKFENKWGDGPRSTPSVDGDRVYCITGTGTVICCRTENGEEVWRRTMQEMGGSTPAWGYCESVLIDGDRLLCTPGGASGTVAALNKLTGEVVWQSTEVTDGAHYSSIIRAEPHGQPQYIQLLEKRLIGLSVDDGRLLWETEWPGQVAMIPTPVFHNGFVYATAGYGVGCGLFEIGPDNSVTEVYRNKTMKSKHDGIVRLGNHIYGYSDGVGWLCQDFHTGEQVWRERQALGKGAIGYADGMLYCIDEKDGEVVLIDASPEGWKEHGRFTLEPQTENRSPSGAIWVHPVIVNGKLYLRDQELLFAFDVSGS